LDVLMSTFFYPEAGEDYHPVYGTIKFTKYVRLYVITIYLIDNPYHEFSEFFSFWLKNLICCPILKPDHISIYIYDDEYSKTPTLLL